MKTQAFCRLLAFYLLTIDIVIHIIGIYYDLPYDIEISDIVISQVIMDIISVDNCGCCCCYWLWTRFEVRSFIRLNIKSKSFNLINWQFSLLDNIYYLYFALSLYNGYKLLQHILYFIAIMIKLSAYTRTRWYKAKKRHQINLEENDPMVKKGPILTTYPTNE